MNKKYIIPGVLVILIVAAWLILGNKSSDSTNIFVKPKTGPFQVTITTNGELQAKNSTEITGPATGMRSIRAFNVKIAKLVPEGTRVKKGDVVAVLDRSQISDNLQDAQQELKQRKSDLNDAKLDTSKTLSDARNSVINGQFNVQQAKIAVKQSQYESPATQKQVQYDLDKAKREYEQQKQSLKLAKVQAESKIQNLRRKVQDEDNKIKNLKKVSAKFTIHAPQNGMVIYARNRRDGTKIKEGDQVSFFDPVVAKLPDFSVMQSITYVSEVDIQKVHKGQNVNISLDAYPDKHLTGDVTQVANIGEQRPNSSTKVFQVTIQINQSDSTLRPAMTTQNIIHTNYVDSALYIPLAAVHSYHDSLNVVYKHHGGQPVMQQIVLGLMNDNNAIVKAGLSKNTQLYLSMPSDTSKIKKILLPDSVVQKYKSREKPKRKPHKKQEPRQKMMRGRGHFPHKKGAGQGASHSK
jgi:multidrug resistance efflux pump